MSNWHTVETSAELEIFLRTVSGFHDGILKEVHWVNRDSVDASLSMHPGQGADARMLIQMQSETLSAVELYFEGVCGLSLDTEHFITHSSHAEVQEAPNAFKPPNVLLSLKLEEALITFERLHWRDASDMMGVAPRFGAFNGRPMHHGS